MRLRTLTSFLALLLAASCGGEPAPEGQMASPSASPSPSPPELGCEDLPDGTEAYAGETESPLLEETGGVVDSRANIFGAGLPAPPAPGGGGGGLLSPVLELSPGASREVVFPLHRSPSERSLAIPTDMFLGSESAGETHSSHTRMTIPTTTSVASFRSTRMAIARTPTSR